MSSLHAELQRLYSPDPASGAASVASSVARSGAAPDIPERPAALIASPDLVRAMVIELARPASWKALSKVWYGVQSELGLPAPAIAVSGTDGFQLWFSLERPIEAAGAHAFLTTLQSRFLPDIDADRLRLLPLPEATVDHQQLHARAIPALQEPEGNWSAFVAADLAPVFADTPWLDIPPNEDGQAALLRGLESISPEALATALKRLGPGPQPKPTSTPASATTPAPPPDSASRSAPPAAASLDTSTKNGPAAHERLPADAAADEARRFLLRVMNDETTTLTLRIDAARALLQTGT